MPTTKFKSLRLTEDTLAKLSDVQLAFESTYMRRFTKDELVLALMDCIEDAEPGVWSNYLLIAERKARIQASVPAAGEDGAE